MVGLFTHKQMSPAWYSPGTVIPLAVSLMSLVYTFRKTGGGIAEWYFVSYQFLFLFRPWNLELRFQLRWHRWRLSTCGEVARTRAGL